LCLLILMFYSILIGVSSSFNGLVVISMNGLENECCVLTIFINT
jgi:hypothetical protein